MNCVKSSHSRIRLKKEIEENFKRASCNIKIYFNILISPSVCLPVEQ